MSEGGEFLLGFGFPGHWEIIIVGGVVVLLFFGRRIPEVMRSLGKGFSQFKKGLRDSDDESGPQDAAGAEGAHSDAKDKDTKAEREAPPPKPK